MTNQHPITPPPELRRLWAQQAQRLTPHDITGWLDYVATQAARWGADQELEAICKWVVEESLVTADDLRNTRRPNPPSLKEQALDELTSAERLYPADWSTIRRALEALPND
jgi:hypothetical protein